MARPVPGRGETRDRGHPRRLSETNGIHGASGYRVRIDAEYATPLAGPTYRAHTRYRLAGPRLAGEKLPTGTRERLAVPRWNPRASARGGCQQPDYTRLLFEEIRTLIEENTREELRSELAAITEEIEEWQATYDIETREELEQSLADGDLASAELRELRDLIAFWRENEEDRRLIKHALELYSDVEAAREQMTDVADRDTN